MRAIPGGGGAPAPGDKTPQLGIATARQILIGSSHLLAYTTGWERRERGVVGRWKRSLLTAECGGTGPEGEGR